MKSRLRWFVLHGLVRLAAKRWAAKGDPQAQLIADESVRHPYPLYEQIRARGALGATRIGHITASHDIVSTVLRSDDFVTTTQSTAVPPPLRWIERATREVVFHPVEPPSLLAVDPPEHTRYRTLVSSVFTARAVAALRPDVQALADGLLDELAADAAAGRPVDIVDRYCARLPVAVISDILGVAESERATVLAFGEQAAPSLDFGLKYAQYRSVDEGLAGFNAWLGTHLDQLRRNPGDNLMSKLIRATTDGVGLSDHELRATAGLVLAAGFETTVNLLGSGIRLLTEHRDQLDLLRADPSLWPNAVDEVLRFESPVQITARVARTETTLAGTTIAAGRLVALLLAGANRDPDVFTDPGRFDVTRENANRHLSFSGGRHYCLGAALARLEGDVALRALFERFPDLAVTGPGARRPTRVLRGWASLPVSLGNSLITAP